MGKTYKDRKDREPKRKKEKGFRKKRKKETFNYRNVEADDALADFDQEVDQTD